MVQIDVPAAVAVGAMFADVSGRQLRSGDSAAFYSVLLKNNFYLIFFFAWIPVYFMIRFFSWETTYMWWHDETVISYSFFVPIFLVVFFLAGNGGLFIGKWLIEANKQIWNRVFYLGILLFCGIWIFAQTDRTLHVGSRAEWLAGNAQWFWEDGTFLTMFIISMVIWTGALGAFLYFLKKKDAQTQVAETA